MRLDIDGYDIIGIILALTLCWTWVRGDTDCSDLCKKQGMYGEASRNLGGCGSGQLVTCICKKPTTR